MHGDGLTKAAQAAPAVARSSPACVIAVSSGRQTLSLGVTQTDTFLTEAGLLLGSCRPDLLAG